MNNTEKIFYDEIKNTDPINYGNYDYLIFEKRSFAHNALDLIEDRISKYGAVSVFDLFFGDELFAAPFITGYLLASQIDPYSYVAGAHVWTNTKTAKIYRAHAGYVLKLPKTEVTMPAILNYRA